MFFDRAGFYVKRQNKEFSMEDYYTFSPKPICEVNVKMDDELCYLLSNAQRLLGLLEGSCRHIRGIENINSLMLKKEAVSSCIIDDATRLTYSDLFISIKNNADEMIPVLNCIKALNYGIDELKRMGLTKKVIYSTHKILMEHRCDEEIIGHVRKKQNKIGNYVVNISGMKTYNPPDPKELNSCMTDIQKFIERNDSIDLLIKAALLHYQIEVVHPFESGNGKIGRIITLLYLFETKILTSTVLPISEFFETHKVEYFDRIKAVYNLGEYEQWIKFFLKALIISADTSMWQIDSALQLRDKSMTLIKANANSTKEEQYFFNAYQHAEKYVFFNVASLSKGIGISYNTAAKIVNTFTDLGILKLLNEQERNRIYLYHDFLSLMGINYLTQRKTSGRF